MSSTKQPVTFLKGDTVGVETDYRDALPVNMYAVAKPLFGADGYMIQDYGLSQFATVSALSRGGFYNDRFSNHFRAQGTDFIEVDEAGVVNVLGAITGTSPVTLDYSFNTQAILAGNRFYLYASGSGFNEVTIPATPAFENPIDFVWVDNYYFFTNGESLYHTEILDETVIDNTSIGVAQFMPDDAKGLGKTQDNKVIVFGRYSTEYFINDGSDEFAFTRVQNRAIKIGIVSTHGKVEVGNNWYILGGRRDEAVSLHVLGVGQAERVATREIEKIIGTYTEPELVNASIETYELDKYRFIRVNLPNHTLVYNETVSKQVGPEYAWSIMKSDVNGNTPYSGIFGVFDSRISSWIVGDRTRSTLAKMDNTVATQYDEIAEWILYTPFLYLENMSIDEFEIETISGFTSSNDATVFISLTYNGVTYGHEWTEDYGMINEYNKRFIVRRLGYVSDWVGIKLRGATRSRMAFSRGFISYG